MNTGQGIRAIDELKALHAHTKASLLSAIPTEVSPIIDIENLDQGRKTSSSRKSKKKSE